MKEKNISDAELLKISKTNLIISIISMLAIGFVAVEGTILFRQSGNRNSLNELPQKSEYSLKGYDIGISPEKTEGRSLLRKHRTDKAYKKIYPETEDTDNLSDEPENKNLFAEYDEERVHSERNLTLNSPDDEKDSDLSAKAKTELSDDHISRLGGSEYASLKFAFIYNFAKFTKWPEGTFQYEDDPIILCLTQRNSSAKAFEKINDLGDREKNFVIVYYDDTLHLDDVHILFDNSQNEDLAKQILRLSARNPVLTVGETEGFLQLGGIINFYTENNRLRYEINIEAAKRSGLKLENRLLISGKIVHSS